MENAAEEKYTYFDAESCNEYLTVRLKNTRSEHAHREL